MERATEFMKRSRITVSSWTTINKSPELGPSPSSVERKADSPSSRSKERIRVTQQVGKITLPSSPKPDARTQELLVLLRGERVPIIAHQRTNAPPPRCSFPKPNLQSSRKTLGYLNPDARRELSFPTTARTS